MGLSLILLLIAARFLLLGSFAAVETEIAHEQTQRVLNALANEQARIDAIAGDWAPWNDTHQFLSGADEWYPADNLDNATLTNLGVHFMLFYDTSGNFFDAAGVDLITGEQRDVAPQLRQTIETSDDILTYRNESGETSGIIMVGTMPSLIAAQPVLYSDFSGPSAGTLIVGRYFDEHLIAELAEQTRTTLTLLPSDDVRPLQLTPLDRSTLQATVSAETLHGDPAFQLQLTLPRDIYQQGEKTLRYFVAAILLLGLLVAAAVFWQLDKQVLKRLTRMGREVAQIGHDADRKSITVTQATDEINRVATTINETLHALQTTHIQLEARVQERTQQLTDSNAQLQAEIAQRKRIEDELREERYLLAERVAQRTHELDRSIRELKSANQHKDDFLATMSHELRTPLNVVLVLAETLNYGIYGQLSAEQSEKIAMIHKSGTHLLQLIQDILDHAKIVSGTFEVEKIPIVLRDLCEESADYVRPQAADKRIRFHTSFDNSVTTVCADPRRLKQILINLLSNAVKFTPEGGQVGLRVVGDLMRRQVQISVWDTGIGISQDNLPKIFEPFVQIDSRLSRFYGGTGIGLPLVKQLAELHDGTVEVASQHGRGTLFTLTLPWDGAIHNEVTVEVSADDVAMTLLENGLDEPTVLLVEDNGDNVQAIRGVLKHLGYQVQVAQNGAVALDMVAAATPDVILMDVQMPVMDGITATKQLRERGSNIPIYGLTALAMPDDRKRCLEAGMNGYLSKPVNAQRLAKTLRHATR